MAMRPDDVCKNWAFKCLGPDQHTFKEVRWFSAGPPECPECAAPSDHDWPTSFGQAPSVIGDEIDLWVRHGLCREDGSPRHFDSMTSLRRAAAEKGLCILGETPKPDSRVLEGRLQREEKAGKLVL